MQNEIGRKCFDAFVSHVDHCPIVGSKFQVSTLHVLSHDNAESKRMCLRLIETS